MSTPISIIDGFDRANTAAGLGISPAGVPWAVLSGSINISGSTAVAANYWPPTIAVVDAGASDAEAQVDISGAGAECLYFRVSDKYNWWRLRVFIHPHWHPDWDYRVALEQCRNGRTVEVATTCYRRNVVYTHLRVRVSGVAIQAFTNVETVPFAVVYDPFNASATKYGIGREVDCGDYVLGPGGLDNFSVVPLDTPPNATPLEWPIGGQSINAQVTNRFSWGFSDVDPGDHQSSARIFYRRAGETSWSQVNVPGPLTFLDFPAGSLALGSYEWQGQSADSHGVWGPRSTSAFFTVTQTPAGFALLEPVAGQRIYTTSLTAVWTTTAQDAAQVRVLGDDGSGNPDPTTVLAGPYTINDPAARTFELSFSRDNLAEHVQLRILSQGLWTDWRDAPIFTAFTPPLRAQAIISPNLPPSAITVTSVHSASIQGSPDVQYVNIWRQRTLTADQLTLVATQWLPGVPFSDFTVRSGTDYEYMIESVAADGALSQSSWFDATPTPNAGDTPGIIEPTVTVTI